MLKSVKVLRSYNAHAQFLAGAEQSGEFLSAADAMSGGAPIPSPYRYSPSHVVYSWQGKKVVWFEVAHRRFEVFEVPAEVRLFDSDNAAALHYIGSLELKKKELV